MNVTIKLAGLWTATMFLFAYADIQHFVLQPGSLEDIQAGEIGDFAITQGFLIGAAALMIIPAVMIFLSLGLKARVGRPLNVTLGIIYTLVTLVTVFVPDPAVVWWYYKLYNAVEIVLTSTIVLLAWRWPRAEGGRSVATKD